MNQKVQGETTILGDKKNHKEIEKNYIEYKNCELSTKKNSKLDNFYATGFDKSTENLCFLKLSQENFGPKSNPKTQDEIENAETTIPDHMQSMNSSFNSRRPDSGLTCNPSNRSIEKRIDLNSDSKEENSKKSETDKKTDLTEIEKELLMEEPLKDKTFYDILIYWISMCNFHGGFNQIFFAPF